MLVFFADIEQVGIKAAGTWGLVMKKSLADSILLLFTVAFMNAVSAQPITEDPYPLRPADTSSPRATINSFLTNVNQGIQLWLDGAPLDLITERRTRALETLDFSQVADNHLIVTKVQHILLLKEILDRIALPPIDQIPGDKEVTDEDLESWTIPDTRITIAKIADGPRKGEFLFQARVVTDLEELYFRSKHLPYQPGATEGIYKRWLEEEGLSGESTLNVRHRLKPIDTSDPRSTFLGFRETLESAYHMMMDADAAFKKDPPGITRQEGRDIEENAALLIQRAMRTLDLSQIPEAIRDDIGTEVALQLKEVLDRIPGTYLDAIPDAESVRTWKLTNKDALLISPEPFRWQFPNTELVITEITDGPRTGEFLFTAETVERAESFYRKMKDLPYRPGATEGFYTFFSSTPGYLVPEAYPLTHWIGSLPPAFRTVYADQTLWQWLGLAISVLVLIVAIGITYAAKQRLLIRVSEPYEEWLKLLLPVFIVFITYSLQEFLKRDLNITLPVITNVVESIVYLMTVWGIFILFKALAETMIASPRIPDHSIDATLLRLVARLMGFLIGAWVLIEGVKDLGLDVIPLLAGLGIGGLALALAARSTIANIIGSFMIFVDRPFRIGQEIEVMGYRGHVESIGLRSTRLRLLNGHLTTIPNEKMDSENIENIGSRPYIRRDFDITITYDTPPDKIERAEEILREILTVPETSKLVSGRSSLVSAADGEDEAEQLSSPSGSINHPDYPPRVFFNEFNPDSLNIRVSYWYHPPEYWSYLEHARWINIQIMERFNSEGIDFAFPTQTLHVAGDEKRPLTVDQHRVAMDDGVSQKSINVQAADSGTQPVSTGNKTQV